MERTSNGSEGDRVRSRQRAPRRWFIPMFAAAIVVTTAYGATALAADGASVLRPNWHIHDGQSALGSQHKGVGFFPRILGISTEQYLQDPARCPNATDKAFLPSFSNSESDVLRAGECETSTVIIHLRTVPLGTSGPAGWLSLTAASEPGFVTYYLVTTR